MHVDEIAQTSATHTSELFPNERARLTSRTLRSLSLFLSTRAEIRFVIGVKFCREREFPNFASDDETTTIEFCATTRGRVSSSRKTELNFKERRTMLGFFFFFLEIEPSRCHARVLPEKNSLAERENNSASCSPHA